MRDRIRIEVKVKTPGASGPDIDWNEQATRWADVDELSVSARIAYQQAGVSEVTHMVTMRGPISLSLADNRFVWLNKGDRILYPVAPPSNKDGLGRYYAIVAREELKGA